MALGYLPARVIDEEVLNYDLREEYMKLTSQFKLNPTPFQKRSLILSLTSEHRTPNMTRSLMGSTVTEDKQADILICHFNDLNDLKVTILQYM